ncbi:hypothetical protein CSPAE12_05081 [Colletotrichum incanum]|nr:hypothetical protein CSPAE12_05081 [Colletotrichum incanum]
MSTPRLSQTITGSITDWKRYIQRCYGFSNLNLGGYLEFSDIDTAAPVSDDGTPTEDTALMKSARLCLEATVFFGSRFKDFARLEGILEEIEFVDTRIQLFKWPTDSWPRDQKHKELGYWNYENLKTSFEAFSPPFIRALGWTKEEVLVTVALRKDLGNKSVHAYYNT